MIGTVIALEFVSAVVTTSCVLLVIGNRDEFHERPTAPLARWPNGAIAGRDLQAGGTWLGVGPGGRIAALTNYRSTGPARPDAPSRGELVADFLQSRLSAQAYLAALQPEASAYNPFNLLVFDGQTLLGLESRGARIVTLQPGIGAVSNADFHTPWPKLRQLSGGLKSCVARNETEDEHLWPLLQSRTLAADDELPHTGVALELERVLSAVFIATPGYGTRACSVVRVGVNEILFKEIFFGVDRQMKTEFFKK